ncbi:MAG: DUF2892 domain-containing protein [Tepidisphaeraceae bacterium]|jgi:hypothetical protein
MQMCKNVGPADGVIRALIGVVALVLAFTKPNVMSGSFLGIIVAAVGVIMLGTAAIGMCPLYLPFKLSTCKLQQH